MKPTDLHLSRSVPQTDSEVHERIERDYGDEPLYVRRGMHGLYGARRAQGDDVLKAWTRVLLACLPDDTLARLSGEDVAEEIERRKSKMEL